jgi:hypothetical protein
VVVSPWAASALSPLEILGWQDPAQHGNGFFFWQMPMANMVSTFLKGNHCFRCCVYNVLVSIYWLQYSRVRSLNMARTRNLMKHRFVGSNQTSKVPF